MSLTHWLEGLDGGTLSRGRAYAHGGRVSVVRRDPEEVVAVVGGTVEYDVTVGVRQTFCTCPMGMRGDLCKHVVAVVLTDTDTDVPAVATPTDRPSRPTMLHEGELDDLVASLRTRGFMDWRRANEHGEHAHRVADRIEVSLGERNADEVREALQRAIPTMVRAILRSDDSSGIQGDATRRLLDLHARAAKIGTPDPVRLARWIVKVGFGDDGFFDIDPVVYAVPLGERGLAAYTREVERRLAADPEDFYPRIARERLAVLSGDVDRIIAEVGVPLAGPYHYQRLVEALLEVGADDAALRFAREGFAKAGASHQRADLADVAVRLLEQRGEPNGAVAIRMQHLVSVPTLSSFASLRRTATSAGTWPAERLDGLDVLLTNSPQDWLRALLADDDTDLAWEASRTMTLGPDLRLQLLRIRTRTHPAEVFDDYQTIIDDTLTESRPENYRQAVKLLGELRRASEAGGTTSSYDAYVATLLQTHRRRPTLVQKLTSMPSARVT